jgi:hypothetical protein
MKTYHLFISDYYYPDVASNYYGSYETYNDTIDAFRKSEKNDRSHFGVIFHTLNDDGSLELLS